MLVPCWGACVTYSDVSCLLFSLDLHISSWSVPSTSGILVYCYSLQGEKLVVSGRPNLIISLADYQEYAKITYWSDGLPDLENTHHILS